MSSNTKIVVLRSKEILYSIIMLVLGILILIFAVSFFHPTNRSNATPAEQEGDTYVPGVYTTSLELGGIQADLQVTVDANHINDISLVNLEESVATMYPLMEPTLDELKTKIIDAQSIENISYNTENRYTSLVLLQAIAETIEQCTQ